MSRICMFVIVVATAAAAVGTNAHAQYGYHVSLYADTLLTDSTYTDDRVDWVWIHTVVERFDVATAVGFMHSPGPGFGGVWLGDLKPYVLTYGSAPTGVSISFGACAPLPIVALSSIYQFDGTSEDCSYLELVPHPQNTHGRVQVVACVGYTYPTYTHKLIVNCNTTPVRETTWGAIKAMYR